MGTSLVIAKINHSSRNIATLVPRWSTPPPRFVNEEESSPSRALMVEGSSWQRRRTRSSHQRRPLVNRVLSSNDHATFYSHTSLPLPTTNSTHSLLYTRLLYTRVDKQHQLRREFTIIYQRITVVSETRGVTKIWNEKCSPILTPGVLFEGSFKVIPIFTQGVPYDFLI